MRHRHVVLGLLMAAFFCLMASRLVISPLVPGLIGTYGVSKAAIGLGLTGMWATSAALQLPGGALADRFGSRTLVLSGLGLTAAGSLGLVASSSYLGFVAAVLVLGIGYGLYFPAAAALLAGLFPRPGGALGAHISGGDLSGLVAPVAAVAVATTYGYRPALGLGAAIALPVFVLCAWRLRPGGPPTAASQGAEPRVGGDAARHAAGFARVRRALIAAIRRPSIVYTVAVAAALAFAFQSVISFYPTFLVEHRGLSTGRAGVLFAAIFLIWIAFTPVFGRLADRVGHDGVLSVTLVSLAAGLAIGLVAEGVVILLAVGLMGVGMSWGGVVASRFMANLPAADRATGYGAVRAVYLLLGSAGSVVTGALAGSAGWVTAYGVSVGLLAAAVVALGINRTLRLGL